MSNFVILFVMYITSSVLGMFLTSKPIELFTLFAVTVWLPLSAITIVPLTDVLRSFTQDAAEKIGLTFKQTASLMLGISFVVAFLCVMFAGLPLPIFAGVLAAVTIGGAADVLVFRKMGQYFTCPVKRMVFSNFAATFVGSGIVFFVAFTDIVFQGNVLAKPIADVVIGWLAQSTFIWISSIMIGFSIQKIKNKF